jgi:dTDP-4-amino-4,6-dideoxygalactose transaminase
MNIPFVDLGAQYKIVREEFLNKLDEIGISGQYILGIECEEFEKELAEFCQCKYVISVANGSDALFLILKALGIGPGDEVITAPNSFLASSWVIVATGATPRYCDVDDGFNLDPNKLEVVISERTKAIIPVHLAGIPAQIEEICEIAKSHGIHVVEDCAQAIGATYRGRQVGTFGIAGGFSLHPLKNLGVMGDGGFVTTDDGELDKKVRLLRNHGLKNRDEMLIWGYNSRLDEIQAALGRMKLKLLNEWNSKVIEIAEKYTINLSSYVKTLKVPTGASPVWHNFPIFTEERESLRNHLSSVGVDTRIHYPIPIHLQIGHNNDYSIGSYPKAEYQSTNSVSLPIYPTLSDVEVNYVIRQIQRYFTDLSNLNQDFS